MKYETEYVNLIKEGLFEDLFLAVDKNISLVENKVEQRKQVREFISILNDNFDNILESGRMSVFAQEFVHAFRDLPVLEESGKKLNSLFVPERVSLLFSFLILSSDLSNAKFLLPYMNKNIESYPNTINTVISNKNSDALRFICENMENTHFNQGEILRKSYDLPLPTIISLIEDFEFDINETNRNGTTNLISELVVNKNIRNFKGIVEKFGDTINWGQNYSLEGGMTIFNIIDNSSIALNFYSSLLDIKDLKSNYVDRIGQTLFKKEDTVKAASNTDIYDKFFSHPNFDHSVFNLNQGFCLYGLLSRIGLTATEPSKSDVSKAYLKIIESFLNSRKDDEMPQATTVHIVGAAIHVAKETQPAQETIDACGLVLRKYRHYINKPNPDGNLPITQVDENSILYRMLINNGAVSPKPPPGFWSSLARSVGLGKKDDIQAQIIAQEEEDRRRREVEANNEKTSYGSFGSLKAKMREDFRGLRQLLASELCDDVVRLRCENMFLGATDLVNKMEKYQLDNTTEDVFFLSQNFSTYLNRSLKSYMKVCEATVDFAKDDDINEKLLSAKRGCLEAIDLLDKQLNLITNNISGRVEVLANNSVRVNKKFLESRLESSSDTLESLDKKLNELAESAPPEASTSFDDRVVSIMEDERKTKRLKI